ncbi:MAG: hypothetical protein ACI87O_003163 [Planctomycetota bacterium]|jgi:hypothetical protein
MNLSRSSTRSSRSQSQIIGVVVLLLMYMAQPVLAAQYAFCACSGMSSSRTCGDSAGDLGSAPMGESSSCCAQEGPSEVSQSCCAGGTDSDAESVCHCPLQPVDSVPSGVVFDGQAFAGPFVWWFALEAHAKEFQLLAPHLGGTDSVEGVQRLAWPPGGIPEPDRGPTGPAAQRLCSAGLIAFLADLSVAIL